MDAVLTVERAVVRVVLGWVGRDLRRRTLRAAAQRAYVQFAAEHPAWAAALFDEHFVTTRVLPLLLAVGIEGAAATAVAAAWAEQFGTHPAPRRQMEALRPARAYLALVAQALACDDAGRVQVDAANLLALG